MSERVDYLSVDVDSTDLWLVEAVMMSAYRPRVISSEFNPNFPYDYAIAFPGNPQVTVAPNTKP